MRDRATETVSGSNGSEISGARLLEPGTLIAGRYRVETVLGVGGSAIVYRVRDELLANRIALKLMRSDRLTPAALVRFRREVAVARTVDNEHVIRIYDIGESEHGVFITMELAEGQSLRSRIESGALGLDETVGIAKQVLDGLSAMHRLHIVHRDIKPGNILIRSDGVVKIADLGLARNFDDDELRATQTDAVVGTWEYLAPEQALGREVDSRADLYSFGVVLYECLAGTLPFPHKSSIGGMIARLREAPRDLRKVRPDTPRWLAVLVDRLLAKEAAGRFASAGEVRRWLDRRRAPLPWKRIASVATAVLVIVAVATGIALFVKRPRFAKLISAGDAGVAAVDSSGEVLWKKSSVRPVDAVVVRQQGKARWVALIENATNALTPRERVLEFFNVDDGRLEWAAPLEDGGTFFEQYPNRFGVINVTAADVSHRGDDLVIVTFVHIYWPSYTIVYDPARRLTRQIFVGSGHHKVLGLVDVNGDGRDDLILGGTNNRMGWYSAITAIDVPPRERSSLGPIITSSPDTDIDSSSPVLWYELLRGGHSVGALPVRTIPSQRRIVVSYGTGRTATLSYDGFLDPLPSTITAAQREALRRAVYADLRRVDLLSGAAQWTEAERVADTARRRAELIADPFLQEWAKRVTIRCLVRAGHPKEAETAAGQLMKTSQAKADIAFDAAHELHLTGHLEEAVHWYREGLLQIEEADSSRLPYEFLEGTVMALSEKQDWNRATEMVSAFAKMFPRLAHDAGTYSDYVRWRAGRKNFEGSKLAPNDRDLPRYWALECAWALQPGRDLLPAIEAEERLGTTEAGLVASLKAEVLASRGNIAEALKCIRSADEWCESRMGSDTAVRGHIAIVRQRLARIEAMSSK